ncbi:hypothetical protein ABN702_02470 [Bacillus haimaensis]|uniref:hypothetical protein n=1 Tax=Bacillus haimaensis TaxID=3160967 RepID=UPI003AA9C879
MPDWSYHGIFKPVLSILPPLAAREFIHRGMNTIASLPFGLGSHIINFLGREECSPLLHKEIHHIDFKNPVGLSGKIDPMLSGTRAFSNLGFGFIEIGPVTLEPRENGHHPVKDNKTKRISFPEVLSSIGLEKTIHKLRKLTKKQPIFIRLSGSIQEVERMAAELDPYADGYIVENVQTELGLHTNKPIWIATSSTTELSPRALISFDGVVVEEKVADFELAEAVKLLRQKGYEKTIVTSGEFRSPSRHMNC